MIREKIYILLACLCMLFATGIAQAAEPAVVQPAQSAQAGLMPPKQDPDAALRGAAEDYMSKDRLRRELDNQAAFERDYDMRFNVTPEQVRKARDQQFRMEGAAQIPVPEAGSTRSHVVSLEPGSKIAVIRCYPQYVTTIRVLDSSGNPWPIVAHMVGNERYFSVQKPDMEPYDTIMVSPLVNTGSTNITLMLDNNEGRDRVPPLSVQLIVSPDNKAKYDTVASIRVDRRGPRAQAPMDTGDGGRFYANETMLAVLDGVPPKEAIRMKSSDKRVEVWRLGESYYVRSSEKLIWPAWTQSITSGEKNGGIYAYEMPPVDSIMFSGNRMVTVEPYPAAMDRAVKR